MFNKAVLLAVLGFSAGTLALPTDASVDAGVVAQFSAEQCWKIPEFDRRDKRECREFNRQCRHREEPRWRLPDYCHGHFYKREISVTQSAAEQCWRLPEHDRRARRECREFNEQCRHREGLDFILPTLCGGHFYKRSDDTTAIAAADCWRLNEHDRRDRRECRDFNDHCRHRNEPHWELPEKCKGHFYY